MNISTFKKAVLDYLVGDRIRSISTNPVIEHIAVRMRAIRGLLVHFVHFKD